MKALPTDVVLYNGGQRCDMISGPCSCGAWHRKELKEKVLDVYR